MPVNYAEHGVRYDTPGYRCKWRIVGIACARGVLEYTERGEEKYHQVTRKAKKDNKEEWNAWKRRKDEKLNHEIHETH